MEHSLEFTNQIQTSRYGFHYFPDSLHYRAEDLQTWLPELQTLGASWLVMRSEVKRGIPEDFIRGLLQGNIEPIIHFALNLADPISADQIEPLLSAYAKWGVHYVIFFERPNSRAVWGEIAWAQKDLVEKFIDQFLPLAQLAVKYDLIPVFPPLEPGGHYWDTVFLRQALETLQARKAEKVLEHLALSAYAWTWAKPLNWGAGGPERWPQTKPYRIPSGSQNQRGFRIFDWYQAIVQAVLQRTCPILLLQAGMPGDPVSSKDPIVNGRVYKNTVVSILRLLNGENVYEDAQTEKPLESIPEEVLCCNFWLLSTAENDPHSKQAWLAEDAPKTLTAQAMLDWRKEQTILEPIPEMVGEKDKTTDKTFSLSRYLLLPSLEWLMSIEQREPIKAYIERYHPVIGFSLKEASQSAVVTVAGDSRMITDKELEELRQCGCFVNRLNESLDKDNNSDNGEEYGVNPRVKHYQPASS